MALVTDASDSVVLNAAQRTWLAWGRCLRQYHRFETRGLMHLDGRPKLLVAYHGRGMALDTIVLSGLVHERGQPIPMSVFHRAALKNPFMAWLIRGVGFSVGRSPTPGRRPDGARWTAPDDTRAAVAAGRHVFVTPGGAHEAFRGSWHTDSVDWGRHVGYLKLAIDLRLPIVPIACTGVDRAYIGLSAARPAGRLQPYIKMPLWLGVGPLGVFPLTPGFPSKFTQIIGTPIDVQARGLDIDDRQGLDALHREIQSEVQALLRAAASQP